MIGLTTVNDSLELVTGVAVDTDYAVTYVDTTADAHTPGSTQGTISTATTSTIVAAPAADTSRGIKLLTVGNRGAAPQALTLQKDVSTTNYQLFACVLQPGETLVYTPEGGFLIHDRAGRRRESAGLLNAPKTFIVPFNKYGTATEGAFYAYCMGKDNGYPGPWSPGTPGVNGRNTDGTTAADAGCLPLGNSASGYQKYLTRWELVQATYVAGLTLWDVLWVNTDLDPTATGAQNIAMAALPARDINGETNGEGCLIGLLVTTATTNAGAVTNSTISYTNSQGTAGRTATLQAIAGFQIPPTANVGTVVWFSLAAGDTGVQSIESITLGTSLAPSGAPTISLIIARPVASLYTLQANSAVLMAYPDPGVRLYDGACLLGFIQGFAGAAVPIFFSHVYIADR